MERKINWPTLIGTVGTLLTISGFAIGFTWKNVILPEIKKEIQKEFMDEKSFINVHIDDRIKFVKENKTYTLSHKLSEEMEVDIDQVHEELGLTYLFMVDSVIPFVRKYAPTLKEEIQMLDIGHKVVKETGREFWLDYDGQYYPVRLDRDSFGIKRRYYIDGDNIVRYFSY